MKLFEKQDFEVRVPGTKFILSPGKSYRIVGRANPDAPKEFRAMEMTKIRDPFNTERVRPTFSEDRNMWDTGLHSMSPCFTQESAKDKEEILETLKKHVIPYLELSLPDGALSYKADNYFWDDKYKFEVSEPITISTNDPLSFFGLYLAILKGTVAPEAEAGNPKYNQLRTAYRILNKHKLTSDLETLEFERSKANSVMINLLTSKKNSDFLYDIFDYLDLKISKNTSEELVNLQFRSFINNKEKHKNARKFLEIHDKFKTKEGRDNLEIYKILTSSIKKGLVEYSRGEYFLEGKSLGSNKKDVADLIFKSNDLKVKLIEMHDNLTTA